MPHYMLQTAYTAEAWAAQVKSPQNRVEAVRPVIERLGGRIESAYYTFGEYDLVVILEFPDNVQAAAFALVAAAGGADKALRTTPLLTIDEGLAALRAAGGAGYRPPA